MLTDGFVRPANARDSAAWPGALSAAKCRRGLIVSREAGYVGGWQACFLKGGWCPRQGVMTFSTTGVLRPQPVCRATVRMRL